MAYRIANLALVSFLRSKGNKEFQDRIEQAHIKSRHQTQLRITIPQYSSMDECRCRYHLLAKKICCQSQDTFAWGQAKFRGGSNVTPMMESKKSNALRICPLFVAVVLLFVVNR